MRAQPATATRPQRTLRVPELRPQMTPAQSRAQDATAAILRRYADEAEAYLAARAAEARDQAREALCPCGIAERDCQCPLRQGRAHAAGARG